MSIENFGRQVKSLILAWLGNLSRTTGQAPLSPFKKWFFLVFLIFLEILTSFQLLANTISLTSSYLQNSKEVNLLQKKEGEIKRNYQFLQAKQTLAEDLLQSLTGSNSQLIENVSLAAGLSQMTLTSLIFDPPENSLKPELLQRRVELTLTGSYENLLTFLERVNHKSPPLVVSDLEISLLEKKAPVGQIEAKIHLVTYYSKKS